MRRCNLSIKSRNSFHTFATETPETNRTPLTRDRVLDAAVQRAGNHGFESLSMRALAHDLGVTTMALYRHVAGKDELIDNMIDRIFSQIDLPVEASDWKIAVKSRILSAREALLRHAWAFRALESRRRPVPTLLAYLDSLVGLFRSAGFSPELTYLALHVLGARALGLDDNLFDPALLFPESPALQLGGMEQLYPHLAELRDAALLPAPLSDPLNETLHSDFELTLDLLLDTIERLTV